MNQKKKFILAITIFIITILIIAFLFSNPDKIFTKNYEEEEPNIGYYNLNYTQNKKDYSYKINIVGDNGNLEPIKDIWINLRTYDEVNKGYLLNNSYSLADYESTKNISFKYVTESLLLEKPFSELDGINLSLSITYSDEDNNDLLSVGDYFILSIKDTDKNDYYDYTTFKFYLRTMDDVIIGYYDFKDPSTSDGPSPSDGTLP